MNTKKYVFRFAAGAAAFFIGHSAFVIGNYVYAGAKYLVSDKTPSIPARSQPEVGPSFAENPTLVPLSVFDNGDIAGEYYLFDEALIKGFGNLDFIEVITTDDNGAPIPIRGAVHTKREHKFTSVTLTHYRLTFETEAIRGVSYRFTGEVDLPHSNKEEIGTIVRGKFTRLEKGKVVGSMYTSFYRGGC